MTENYCDACGMSLYDCTLNYAESAEHGGGGCCNDCTHLPAGDESHD